MKSKKNKSSKDRKKHSVIYYRYLNYLVLLFIMIIACVPILSLIIPDQKFSPEENRVLAQLPRFTLDVYFEGRYTKKFEKYVGDQMPGRNSWIHTKTSVDQLLGKKMSNGVFLGAEDQLIEDFVPQDPAETQNNKDAINNFYTSHPEINHYFMLVPTAISIDQDKLPKNAPVINQMETIKHFVSGLDKEVTILDPSETLMNNNDKLLYYKTDHHWTTLGSWLCFQDVAPLMDIKLNSDAYTVYPATRNFVGALTSKSGYTPKAPDIIDVYLPKDEKDYSVVTYVDAQKKSPSLYSVERLNEKDKYAVFLDGNHPIVTLKNNVANKRNLLLFKDSYANAFIPFLTPYFSEITVIDPRYYYENLNNLLVDSDITDILYLYNANTFFQDNSLSSVLNDD